MYTNIQLMTTFPVNFPSVPSWTNIVEKEHPYLMNEEWAQQVCDVMSKVPSQDESKYYILCKNTSGIEFTCLFNVHLCVIFNGNKGIKCLTVCNFVFILCVYICLLVLLFIHWSVRTDHQHRLRRKFTTRVICVWFLIEVLNKGLESWKAALWFHFFFFLQIPFSDLCWIHLNLQGVCNLCTMGAFTAVKMSHVSRPSCGRAMTSCLISTFYLWQIGR